eukprot:scaffold5163_cov38-Prasinocladus_malaysianus.AAC.1
MVTLKNILQDEKSAGGEGNASGVNAATEGNQRSSASNNNQTTKSEAAPGLSVKEKWKAVGENERLGNMVGAAMVVKRDLHRRAELREKLEGLNRRPSVFNDTDRQARHQKPIVYY